MIAIAATIFIGACLIAAMFALSAVIISSRISRQEESWERRQPWERIIEDAGKE